MWAAAFNIKYQLHHMPGRPCAVSVLELNSLKFGREKPHQALIRLSGSSYSLVPAVSFLFVEVNAPTIPCCNNPSEREHLLVPSTTRGGKTQQERGGKSVKGGNSPGGSRRTIERSSDRENPHAVSLLLTHPFPLQSWITVKTHCFATHD